MHEVLCDPKDFVTLNLTQCVPSEGYTANLTCCKFVCGEGYSWKGAYSTSCCSAQLTQGQWTMGV